MFSRIMPPQPYLLQGYYLNVVTISDGHTTYSWGAWGMDGTVEIVVLFLVFSCFLFHYSYFSRFSFIPLSNSIPSTLVTSSQIWTLCCVTTLKTISLHYALSEPADYHISMNPVPSHPEDCIIPVWTLCCVTTLKTISFQYEPCAVSQPDDRIQKPSLWKPKNLMSMCLCSFPERHRNYKYHWWTSWGSSLQLM